MIIQINYRFLLILSVIVLQSCSKTIQGELIITNVNIINVKTGEVNQNKDIIIDGDKITSIVATKSNTTYKSENVIDGSDKYLIPGLWDMHTHTWWGYEEFFPLLIANGVTGIQEMSGDLTKVKFIKNQIAKGEIVGPEIISSGRIIDGKPAIYNHASAAGTPEEGRNFVRKQKAAGADFIKVYSLLSRDTYLAIADECKQLKIPFYGHVPDVVPLDVAVKAGQKSIEHFFGILEFCSSRNQHYHSVFSGEVVDTTLTGKNLWIKMLDFPVKTHDEKKVDPLINMLSESATWVSPSNVMTRAYSHGGDEFIVNDARVDYMPDYLTKNWGKRKRSDLYYSTWKSYYSLSLSLMKPMLDGGVKFLAATDYANPYCFPGFSLHDELEIFVENGFTPQQALQTATINPAKFLGLENDIGTVDINKIANLVLLSKNPLNDISNTRKIDNVIVRGEPFSKDQLQNKLDSILIHNRLPKIREELMIVIEQKGIESALNEYENLKETKTDLYNFDKYQLDMLGEELMDQDRYMDALKIFQKNIDEFPNYASGYESVGDAYLSLKDTLRAEEFYKKALGKNIGSRILRKLEQLK